MHRATGVEGDSAKLARIGEYATNVRMPGPSVPSCTIFFAVGSTIFSYLLLRGRMVPVSIAWLGVFASGLLVAGLSLQLAGFPTGPLTGYYQWLPALVFQIVLALWLLIKGVATPATHTVDAMSPTPQDV